MRGDANFGGRGCRSDVVPFLLIEKNYRYHSRERREWLPISSDCNKIEPPIFYEIGSQNIKSWCIMFLSTLDAGLTCWTAQQLNHVRHWQGRVLHWLTTYFELMYFYVFLCINLHNNLSVFPKLVRTTRGRELTASPNQKILIWQRTKNILVKNHKNVNKKLVYF